MPPAPNELDDLRKEMVRIVARIKRQPRLEADPGREWLLADLGFDSLDLVELAEVLARDYRIELGAEPDDLAALSSTGTLADLVSRRRSG
jgi:acyl carrier protein